MVNNEKNVLTELGAKNNFLFLIFMTETILRTDEGQPRTKYIFNKCGTNIYFFTLQRFNPSPSPNFKLLNKHEQNSAISLN